MSCPCLKQVWLILGLWLLVSCEDKRESSQVATQAPRVVDGASVASGLLGVRKQFRGLSFLQPEGWRWIGQDSVNVLRDQTNRFGAYPQEVEAACMDARSGSILMLAVLPPRAELEAIFLGSDGGIFTKYGKWTSIEPSEYALNGLHVVQFDMVSDLMVKKRLILYHSSFERPLQVDYVAPADQYDLVKDVILSSAETISLVR